MISLTTTNQHIDLIKQWAQCPQMKEFFRRHPPLFTWDDTQVIAQAYQTSYIIRQDDQPVGLITLANFDPQHKKVELGLLIDKERITQEPQTIYLNACKQVANYVFNYLGYEKIYTLVLKHRTRLMRVMELGGFKSEGVLRHNIFWNGEFHDEMLFSLLKEDYYKRYQQDVPKEAS